MARVCSIARTLEVIGERWALLVLRETMLGNRRFEDIRDATGAPRAVLTRRLKTLVDQGILERRSYQDPGQRARSEYRPTEAGRELQTVLTALMDWGDRHLSDAAGPPALATHRDCGGQVHVQLRCAKHHEITPREITVRPAGNPAPRGLRTS